MNEIRTLKADEIECRIARFIDTGVALLLYKDARCDMRILDEVYGPLNWQCEYSRDNANCTVSIWDDNKKQWIRKEDTGTESNTEKEKGLASDSFKRACFKWGIGRELYTAPDILINIKRADAYKCKFVVREIDYDDKRNISKLEIVNANDNFVVFSWQAEATLAREKTFDDSEDPTIPDRSYRTKLLELANMHQIDLADIQAQYGLVPKDTEEHYKAAYEQLKKDIGA